MSKFSQFNTVPTVYCSLKTENCPMKEIASDVSKFSQLYTVPTVYRLLLTENCKLPTERDCLRYEQIFAIKYSAHCLLNTAH